MREQKKGPCRKKWEVNTGAEVTPLSVGIVFGAEVLMHVLFWLPRMSESDGALREADKWQLWSALSHSSGYLHTQEEH